MVVNIAPCPQTSAAAATRFVEPLCLAIVEHAPLPMATVDGATHIVRYANPAFYRLMDKSEGELVGKPISELLPEKDECVRLLDRVFRTGKPESYTEKEISKPHPVFWSYTMWPVFGEKRPIGVMIQVTETTKFHEQTVAMNEALMLGSVHQHELTEAAERLNAQLRIEISARQKTATELSEVARLLDLSNDAIIVHDLDDKISLWNKGAEKLYGWESGEVIGKQLHLLLQTEFPKPLEEIVAQLQSEGQFSGEVVQVTRDGRRVPSLCRMVLDRGTKTILTSYTDISKRKEFEEARETYLVKEQALRMEAEAANRSKDLFLATLSHEVRTPLNAILGWAAILRTGKCDPADFREGMEVIERNCKAQAQLIEDVLDVSRIVSGKLQLQIRPCELVEVINAAIDVVRPAADARGIRLEAAIRN